MSQRVGSVLFLLLCTEKKVVFKILVSLLFVSSIISRKILNSEKLVETTETVFY